MQENISVELPSYIDPSAPQYMIDYLMDLSKIIDGEWAHFLIFNLAAAPEDISTDELIDNFQYPFEDIPHVEQLMHWYNRNYDKSLYLHHVMKHTELSKNMYALDFIDFIQRQVIVDIVKRTVELTRNIEDK